MASRNNKPLRVGLTGGIASGKTTVADMFARLGVPVIDTDVIAREVVAPGEPALDEIRQRFGEDMVDAAGNPFSRGFPITFEVTGGPANTAVSTSSTLSDVDGYASTRLTAGETIGAVQVTATADGLTGSPVTFSAAVVPGTAATMAPNTGNGQVAVVGTALTTPPSVIVTDDNGDPVPDIIVTFTVASGAGSVTGAVDTTEHTSLVSGINKLLEILNGDRQ